MKQSNFDKWLTTDPNGEPEPELITVDNSRCSDFSVDGLTCRYCDKHIGFIVDEHGGFAGHDDFVYLDVGGAPGEIFCCVVCAEGIIEFEALVKP